MASAGGNRRDGAPIIFGSEPWRRFESKVDASDALVPAERARRAKIAYRAFMRGIARKSVKARAAAKARRAAALQRRLAKGPSEGEHSEFRREREETVASQIVWAAAQHR